MLDCSNMDQPVFVGKVEGEVDKEDPADKVKDSVLLFFTPSLQ